MAFAGERDDPQLRHHYNDIITTTPNALCADIHNRMPVIFPLERWPAWLGEEAEDGAQLQEMLAPYPSDRMTC